MDSQQFQAAHSEINNLCNKILQFTQDSIETDNNAELANIAAELKNTLEVLGDRRYQVAVIAAMKAGKSTFLNATIGADILASESEACTVCRTDVRPIKSSEIPKLLEYREGEKEPVIISEGEVAKIREDFLKRTHKIRQNNNSDRVTCFELWHPIEAISKYSCLDGFTLVDTPGPNEWESAEFNTVALKETALEALRTCNAILFILDYTSFKDDTNQLLLKDLIEQRKDFLAESAGKIYFLLNKVDRKSEQDRPIYTVIKDLKRTLIGFGIPDPIIYPLSAWKGLLAKLIITKKASKSHKQDFKNFFYAKYIDLDDDDFPRLIDVAPKALEDSGLLTIESAVIQSIIKNSGRNFLKEILAKLEKQARAIEDTLNTQISGWEMEIDTLKQKIEDFKIRSESTKKKVATVKKSVGEEKRVLVAIFSKGLKLFAEEAKSTIADEIDNFALSKKTKYPKNNSRDPVYSQQEEPENNWFADLVSEIGGTALSFIPVIGKPLATLFKVGFNFVVKGGQSLSDRINDSVSSIEYSQGDPYIIQVKSIKKAKKVYKTINNFVAPQVQNWWLDTQDRLVREGTKIRTQIAQKIQQDIQAISNQMTEHLGESLNVKMNVNSIQFPDFEFKGIDAKIKQQQEVIRVTKQRKETRSSTEGLCNKKRTFYTVNVPYEDYETRSYYEIDLRKVRSDINRTIDSQTNGSKILLERVINKQISEDFKKAEKQIDDYIYRMQDTLNKLLRDRNTKSAKSDRVIAMYKVQKEQIEIFLQQLNSLRQEYLDA
ncbi:MAG: dynamin family protein [Prochloraceae cyanobacterium]